MWQIGDIADAIADAIRADAACLDEEHAVRGIDVRDELELHPVLATGLEAAGFGVHREQRYPADRHRRRETEGERCDLVLTHDAHDLLASDREATLFDDPDAVSLDDAFWLEVKVVAQYGEDGPSRNYSSQFLNTTRADIGKLSKDPGILHAALLIVLFAADRTVAEHDLGVWLQRCLKHGAAVAAPSLRYVDINDRHGNGVCAVAVYPVWHL